MKSTTTQPGFFKKILSIALFIFLCSHTTAFAQEFDEEEDEDGLVQADGRPDPDLPLDGGVIFLLAGGVGYGLIKLYVNSKQKTV